MAKFYGEIGFAQTKETSPDVWTEEIMTRQYTGDLLSSNRKLQSSADTINDGINLTNRISVIADPYAFQNFFAIRYVTYMGSKWKVIDAEVVMPRLILSLGGLYNDQTEDRTGEDS